MSYTPESPTANSYRTRWSAPVVVGVSDLPLGSQLVALDFASAEANRRGADVVLVHGCVPLATATALDPTVPADERYRRGEELIKSAAAHLAPSLGAGRRVETRVIAQTGADALIELSATASIVVVERRMISAARRMHTGSTTARVCAQAESAVAVVKATSGSVAGRSGVAVGIDSRGHADAALQVAFVEASLRQQPLIAVHAWDLPGPLTSYSYIPPSPEELSMQYDAAKTELAEALAGYGEEFPDVVVRRHVIRGAVTEALIDAGTRAQILVVGRHSRHGIASLGLGSAARHCLQHAECPIIVAPPSAAPHRPGRWRTAEVTVQSQF